AAVATDAGRRRPRRAYVKHARRVRCRRSRRCRCRAHWRACAPPASLSHQKDRGAPRWSSLLRTEETTLEVEETERARAAAPKPRRVGVRRVERVSAAEAPGPAAALRMVLRTAEARRPPRRRRRRRREASVA